MRALLRSGFTALLLTLAITPALLAQQGAVAGRVTDSETGEALSQAQIQVLGGGRSTGGLTDDQGRYRIPVAPGSYSVAVTLIGHENGRVDGVDVQPGQTATVDFALASTATLLNPIVVTASRREEKALTSPSTIVTVGPARIEERASVTPVDAVKALPGVDVAQTGLTQANVVTRGFNNVFSGSLLVLVDNRYASVPSLRVNNYNMIPTTQMDVEREEVLLGPAAALYGPNSASGVLHIITWSPIDHPGGAISVAGGDRNVVQGQFRYGVKISPETGFKVSGQWFRGDDWKYVDPVEAAAHAANPGNPLIGNRDYTAERWGGSARFDWRPWDDGEVIVNGGLNTLVSSIELTGLGAGQAKDWRYSYLQSRLRKGRLFAQAFVNMSDAGNTYLLRTGQPIVDKSQMWVGQVQDGFSVGGLDVIGGVDAQRTIPRTEGTITGRNENNDQIDEVGGYVHTTTALTDQVDIVAALRSDWHSRLDGLNWSPRAALVFHPDQDQSFRLTYNRAFSTPTTNNLFLDIVAARDPFGFANFGIQGNDIRTLGVPESGFTFHDQCAGGLQNLCMYSPIVPGQQLPANAAVLWDQAILPLVAQQAHSPGLIQLLGNPQPGQIGSRLLRFSQEGAAQNTPFLPDAGPTDIAPLTSTITTTYEAGYKGILGKRLLVTGDVYKSYIKDFVGPLRVETPSVFFDPTSLAAFVQGRLTQAAQAGQFPASQIAATTQAIVSQVAQIPVGTVAPDQSTNADLILTYRNFGDVNLWGSDLAFQLLATDRLSFTGSYSYVSKDCKDFNNDGKCTSAVDIALNAPKNKGSLGVRWDDPVSGITLEGRARMSQGFIMNSGVYVGTVDGYTSVDANAAFQLRAIPGARVMLTVTNLLDDVHREFVGAPAIGRLALLRLQYTF